MMQMLKLWQPMQEYGKVKSTKALKAELRRRGVEVGRGKATLSSLRLKLMQLDVRRSSDEDDSAEDEGLPKR